MFFVVVKLSMQASVYIGLYPLYGADEVSGEVVTEQSLSYMLLFMVPEQVETGTVFHTASVFILVLFPCLIFVLWSSVLGFVYPSLEISVTQ